MRVPARWGVVAALLGAGGAQACGHCVEDRIAAAYDHAVLKSAAAKGHAVAFFALEPAPQASPASLNGKQLLEAAAGAVPGVDAGTARASVEPGALSVAYNPARTRLPELQRALQNRLARRGYVLLPLQVMRGPGDMAGSASAPVTAKLAGR